jgi:hypothetical protein
MYIQALIPIGLGAFFIFAALNPPSSQIKGAESGVKGLVQLFPEN